METKALRSVIETYPIIFLILTHDSTLLSNKARMFVYVRYSLSEVLSPVCGKPQVFVSSQIFFEPKIDISFGFEADDVVASGLKEEINLLAANFQKFPPRLVSAMLFAAIFATRGYI